MRWRARLFVQMRGMTQAPLPIKVKGAWVYGVLDGRRGAARMWCGQPGAVCAARRSRGRRGDDPAAPPRMGRGGRVYGFLDGNQEFWGRIVREGTPHPSRGRYGEDFEG